MKEPSIIIDVVWDDPKGIGCPELAATWARVCFRIGDFAPTRVLDRRSKTVREDLYLPTYPLAEWIACNWFPIFHENPNPRRHVEGWADRHRLRSGREGFAAPPLEFAADGQTVQIACSHLAAVHEPVEFLTEGVVDVPAEPLRNQLSAFVSLTVSRLDAKGIEGTRLQEEWAALQALDVEEEAFCTAAAQLGYDPFSLDDNTAVEIVNAAGLVPEEVRQDFFDCANLTTIATDVACIRGHIKAVAAKPGRAGALSGLRAGLKLPDSGLRAWRQGYELARRVRAELGIADSPLNGWRGLLAALGLDEAWRRSSMIWPRETGLHDSLVGPGVSGGPVFAIPKRGAEARRFAFCRALAGHLETGGWALATASHSARQKRNRAFAAEFLAPAEAIRKALPTGMVDGETLLGVARGFGVSEFVVKHQIENHQLAKLC